MSPIPLTKTLRRKAQILELAGEPVRIKILHLLNKLPSANVTHIAKELNINIACTSHHLQLLKKGRLVQTNRRGNSIFYSLTNNNFTKQIISLI